MIPPSSTHFTSPTSKPAICALAGFVPCALSGTSITLRSRWPSSSKCLRKISIPENSPCAPAAGCSETASMPVQSAIHSCMS